MSENLPQKQNEEVDIGQLFVAIGNLFSKLFKFISDILKALFRGAIFALKPIVNHFKLIAIIIMISGVVGFVVEKFNSDIYFSDMLVRPHFESKYQLANNVNYFNALIASRNISELSEIFEIDSVSASKLLGFEVKIGPETPNDLLVQYDTYIKSIDSVLAVDVSYEEFIENRDILSGNVFSIKAMSQENDVFVKLEQGFRKTFENDYSKKLKKIRDSTILIQKNVLNAELVRVDSLQTIYIQILKTESENSKVSIGIDGMFPLKQERSLTREYDLFQKEIQIRDALRDLDKQLIEESVFYDVIAGFEQVGSKESSIWTKYSLLFPVLVFALMVIVFVLYKVFNFIKDYE